MPIRRVGIAIVSTGWKIFRPPPPRQLRGASNHVPIQQYWAAQSCSEGQSFATPRNDCHIGKITSPNHYPFCQSLFLPAATPALGAGDLISFRNVV